jgi:uncharacterized membrane protein
MFELFSRRRRTPEPKSLLIAALVGAASASAVAVLNKAQRRARIRDRASSAVLHFVDLADKARRDAKNRATGLAAHAAARRRNGAVSDEKLIARVRAMLGHATSHVHAIELDATEGHIVLRGPILRGETDRLLRAVRRVPGVRSVESRLEEHGPDEHVPALQGAGGARHVPELMQKHWTPSLRVGAALFGAAVIGAGITRLGSLSGIGLSGLGALLLARASLDKPVGRILGIGADRDAIELRKTMTIRAPIEEVFAYWASFERFPDFMDHVSSVQMTSERRSHWKVRGPLGTTVEWDAETTRIVPNERIEWSSVEGSRIKNAGVVRFEPAGDGRATRIDVRISYNPVVGYLGHGIAALFRVDPKKSLDDDLLRLKSLIEEGSATAHGHKMTRDAHPVAFESAMRRPET